ncbi:acyl-CoA synthetase [Leeia sp. TBRC 13508]|uniref:Acyl-CoA synthetase n=1 Tax=Leeia speluncae TaxID=2884804 RepID=A0ABS8D3Z1_9NEIS|nr:acyl-CoA synthetase [Leeia speluncae]MCB6182910.1 acyl-CoA synthetase [Leeia speluncae]
MSEVENTSPEWMQQKERGSMFWLRIMLGLSNFLGRNGSRLILHLIAVYFFVFSAKARKHSATYLARALKRKPRLSDRYRHFLVFATTIHDRLYLLQDKYSLFDIGFSGAEAVNSQLGQQGMLLFGAHMGSFEVLRAVARKHPDVRMNMAMYSENAQQINALLKMVNPECLGDIIELGSLEAMLTVHQRLKENRLVGILADRASGPDEYVAVEFLGKTARFPTGPFRMAVMLGFPLYFMAGLYAGGNRYEVVFEEITSFAEGKPKDRAAAVEKLVKQYAETLERFCESYPYNWFNYYDFWEEHATNA